MTRTTLLLAIATAGACSAAPVPVEAPRPPAAAPAPAPPAPREEPEIEEAPAPRWKACMISRADLEAQTGEKASFAPDGGQILALLLDQQTGGGVHQSLHIIIGLTGVPPANQTLPIKGDASTRRSEHADAIEAGDRVDGQLVVSADASSFDVTLRAREALREMFASDGIHHFTVKVTRIRHTSECL